MVSAKDSFLAAVNWFLRKNGHGARLFFYSLLETLC